MRFRITLQSSSRWGETSLEQRSTNDSNALRQFSTTSWSFSLSPPSIETSCSVAWFTICRNSGAMSRRCWPMRKPTFLLTVLMHWMYFCFSVLVEAERTSERSVRMSESSWRSASTEESAPMQAITFFRSDDLYCFGFRRFSSEVAMFSWSDHCMTRLSPNLFRKSWKTSVHSSFTSTEGCVVIPWSIFGRTFWHAGVLQEDGSSDSRPFRQVA
mmetsp:Transcript_43675/g.123648  ORF Transcript_43675/g.123648 Transcript_43675/m.123648 type:complete len:214 (+) Transcript_43675:1563-2204(+)